MRKITQKELLKELDKMNKDGFKYMGLYHSRSGLRSDVELQKEFIKNLNAKIIKEFHIKAELNPSVKKLIERGLAIPINIEPDYVNIYEVKDVKEKIKGISKEKCVTILKSKID
jgi:hypothetical protein